MRFIYHENHGEDVDDPLALPEHPSKNTIMLY